MILIGNINVLPCFENIHKVCKPNIIPRKTDAKLKRWSKFGLLRYSTTCVQLPAEQDNKSYLGPEADVNNAPLANQK